MKANVLHIVGSFDQGGTERQAVQLLARLKDETDLCLSVACFSGHGVLRTKLEEAGFLEISEFPLTSFYNANMVRQLRRCIDLIKTERIDIIHTHDFYTNVFGLIAARFSGRCLKIASKRETGMMRSFGQERIEMFLLRGANAIVANSIAVKNYLTDRGISNKKIEVIYNGLDSNLFESPEKPKNAILKELNLTLPEDAKLITLVANLHHTVKNHPMFLRAAARVLKRFPDTHFIVAGEGELRGELEELCEALGIAENIHFTGRCSSVPALLSVSYAGVLTSFAEGFSNSVLEYMAAGLPVVATRVGGAAEVIEEAKTGFLVDSDAAAAMAEKLIDLLEDEVAAAEMGAAGKDAVSQRFLIEVQKAKTLELYEKLMATSS